jgi:16S rRNA (guanine527-N7)-methyltransferase
MGLLEEGLAALGVPEAPRVAGVMEGFLREVEKWNPRFGLVKASGDGLVVKHVLDSLSAWGLLAELAPATVVDIGSGAGFPGIPLAAAFPGTAFTLMERSTRRASFLGNCALVLGLPNVTVVPSDMSEAAGDFDCATFRAFAPLDRFLADLARSRLCCRSLLAFKGREDRAREELERAREAGWAGTAEVRPARVPYLVEERCLVVIRDLRGRVRAAS